MKRRRLLVWLLGVPLVLVVLTLLAGGLALHDPQGLSRALHWLAPHLPGELSVRQANGPLGGPWRLAGVHYRGEDGLTVEIDSLEVSWSPSALFSWRLHVDRVAARGVTLRLPSATPAAQEAPAAWALPALPVALRIADLTVDGLRVVHGDRERLAADRVALAARFDGRGLRLERLDWDARELQFELAGVVRQGLELPLELRGRWHLARPGQPPVGGPLEIAGDLQKLTLQQRLEAPFAAAIELEVTHPLTALAWQGRATLREVDLSALDSGLPPWPLTLDLAAQGTLEAYTGRAEARWQHPELGDLHADSRFDGDLARLGLTGLTLRLGEDAARLRLAAAQVTFDGPQPRFNADGSWEEVRWPRDAPPDLASQAGRFTIDGTPDDFRLEASGDLQLPGLPVITWSGSGQGDKRALELREFAVALADGGGRVDGAGRVAWTPRLSWELAATAHGIDTGRLDAAWPGKLDGPFRVTGEVDAAGTTLAVTLEEVAGTLRETPFTAAGGVQRTADGRLLLDELTLRSGTARAVFNGLASAPMALQWKLEAADLAALQPGFAGRVQAAGELSGEYAAPRIAARGAAVGVDLGPRGRAKRLDFTLNAALDAAGGPLDAVIDVAGLDVAGQAYGAVRLAVRGTTADHAIELTAAGGVLDIELAAHGAYANARWQGTLQTLALHEAGLGRWVMQAPAALDAAAARIALGRACWRHVDEDLGEACVAGEWHADGRWQAVVEADGVPLAALDRWLPGGTRITGEVALDMSLEVAEAGAAPRGIGTLRIGSGVLTPGPELGTTDALRHSGGSGTLNLDAAGIRASLQLGLAAAGELHGRLALPGARLAWPLPAATPLEGELRVALDDLAPFASLLPAAAFGDGTLRGELTLAGSVGNPITSGRLELALASVALPAAGVTLHEVRSTAVADGGALLRLSGSARSGDGQIDYSGELRLAAADGWPLELRITGERFLAVDLPELRLLLAPEVTLRLVGRDLSLDGRVQIPEAEIRPLKGRSGLARVSSDTVVVGKDAPDAAPARALRASVRLRMELGERVRFDGYGLKGLITGAVDIESLPGSVPHGRGELRIENAAYSGYGTPLEIERGRLLFASSPLDNPGIDASAVRRAGDVTAGVRLRGTLSDPTVTLFSTPPLSQADILAYVVLGSPLQASGDAAGGEKLAATAAALGFVADSPVLQDLRRQFGIEEFGVEADRVTDQVQLVLGRHLSPDVYVGYVVGLTDPTSVFRIRYQLSKRWSIEAESGTRSGADLNFSIER